MKQQEKRKCKIKRPQIKCQIKATPHPPNLLIKYDIACLQLNNTTTI